MANLKDKLNSKKFILVANIFNVIFLSLCVIGAIIVQCIKGFTIESAIWIVCVIAVISFYEFGIRKIIFKPSGKVVFYILDIIIPLTCIVLSCIFAQMWTAASITFSIFLIVYIARFILK